MLEKLRTLPELRDVASDQQTAGAPAPRDVDRDTASRLGITSQLVDDTLYDAFGQRQVATMFTQLNQYRVVLEVKPELAAHPDALDEHLRADRRRAARCRSPSIATLHARRRRRCRSTTRASSRR